MGGRSRMSRSSKRIDETVTIMTYVFVTRCLDRLAEPRTMGTFKLIWILARAPTAIFSFSCVFVFLHFYILLYPLLKKKKKKNEEEKKNFKRGK